VTAHLRRLWGLNHILADTGEKNRADHRHHALDALVVACAHPGVTQMLSRFWQMKDDPRAAGLEKPMLAPPWASIRQDAQTSADQIIVSHKVRKKVSGGLHKETVYGDTGETEIKGKTAYSLFVRRKKVEVLTKGEYEDIRDPHIARILQQWLADRGGDPKKINWSSYPRVSETGPEIRSVRILIKQQKALMAPVSTGYADLGSNHHIAIYRRPDGKAEFEVVSLFEASRRLAKREPIVRRERPGCSFVMSLAAGDMLEIPSGDKAGIWTVTGAWSSGQLVIEKANDAAHGSVTRPMPNSILKEHCRKISVDPIGRVRPAND
jgi:CRISPR-associated endonuclease Csn1